MLKRLVLFLIIPLFFLSVAVLLHASYSQSKQIKTVIVDAGHGGIDPGARGSVTTEAQVALAVALKLGSAIQEEFPSVKVIYTRKTDILPGNLNDVNKANRYRAQMANDAKGDLYISIHCNAAGSYQSRIARYRTEHKWVGKGKKKRKMNVSVPVYERYFVPSQTRGTETYVWAADRSSAKSEYVNESQDDSSSDVDVSSHEALIKAQLWVKAYFKNSYTLAKYVEDEYAKTGRPSRGVMQRNDKGIWVLQATGMPSILTEIGFITSKEEEQYLNSEEGQTEIAKNILAAFKRYKTDVEAPSKARQN